jgi:hypothetical protein
LTTHRLAIVIPAYKAAFLAATLDSIAAQTDQSFHVYVGDDASPHDLKSICAQYSDRIAISYTRFESNLGQTDLVAHWTRCVVLSTEPWVWLFSDDDLMDAHCVAALQVRISTDHMAADLYHFDVIQIDSNGEEIRHMPPFPENTDSAAFALARMEYRLSSFAPDYVFRRSALDRVGGFQPFPAAWCADDATWIKLAQRAGIHAVRGPKVRWRLSGQNISAANSSQAPQKLDAAVLFVAWLEHYFSRNPNQSGSPSTEQILVAARGWLSSQSHSLRVGFWWRGGPQRAWILRRCLPLGFLGAVARTAVWDLRLRWRQVR